MTSLRSGVKLTLMKKLSLYVFLGLLICNIADSKIIYTNCDLEPNYDLDTVITIDLELKTIKLFAPKESGVVIHDIQEVYGDVIVSSNLKYTSAMSLDATKEFTKNVLIELSFDIENHTISLIVGKKPGIPKDFSEYLDKQIADGELKSSIRKTCDVKNTYTPTKLKKLLQKLKN